MKAALITRYGGNDVVKVADTAVPVIGSMDLLVQVHAASVNPVDVKTRDGQLKMLCREVTPLAGRAIRQPSAPPTMARNV